ncbi:MAG: hypothetical protein PVH64_00150 [Bacillota bacterium]
MNVTQSSGIYFRVCVKDPAAFGVVEFAENGRVLSLEEKSQVQLRHTGVVFLVYYPHFQGAKLSH